MERRLRAEWDEYRARVVPADASATQLRETLLAFMAGAYASFAAIVGGLSNSDEPTTADMDLLESLEIELREHQEWLTRCAARGDWLETSP
jgi:hypothetical protein